MKRRHDTRPRCRRCGARYTAGEYGDHSRSIAHQRQLRLDRKARTVVA